MLADPQTVTIGSSPGTVSLPRVSTGSGNSEYSSADGTIDLRASSTYGRRTRRLVRLDIEKVSSDVFLPATNVSLSASVYVVFDHPKVGFTVTELKDLYLGLTGQLTASSNAVLLKVLGGES